MWLYQETRATKHFKDKLFFNALKIIRRKSDKNTLFIKLLTCLSNKSNYPSVEYEYVIVPTEFDQVFSDFCNRKNNRLALIDSHKSILETLKKRKYEPSDFSLYADEVYFPQIKIQERFIEAAKKFLLDNQTEGVDPYYAQYDLGDNLTLKSKVQAKLTSHDNVVDKIVKQIEEGNKSSSQIDLNEKSISENEKLNNSVKQIQGVANDQKDLTKYNPPDEKDLITRLCKTIGRNKNLFINGFDNKISYEYHDKYFVPLIYIISIICEFPNSNDFDLKYINSATTRFDVKDFDPKVYFKPSKWKVNSAAFNKTVETITPLLTKNEIDRLEAFIKKYQPT